MLKKRYEYYASNPDAVARVCETYYTRGCDECIINAFCSVAGVANCREVWRKWLSDDTGGGKFVNDLHGLTKLFTCLFHCGNGCPVYLCNGISDDNVCCMDVVQDWLTDLIDVAETDDDTEPARTDKNADPVNNPSHYMLLPGVQVIDVIKAILRRADYTPVQSFYLGNALKYILRADLKGGREDYEKCIKYLDWLVTDLIKTENGGHDETN